MLEAIWAKLAELQHASPHLLKAMLAGTLVSTACGVMGCFIILRRTAFLADALAHAMLAGVVCGYLFMKVLFGVDAHATAMLLGSLVSGLLTVLMVGYVSRRSRLKEDTVIGVMYTGVFAFGGVLLSYFSEYVHIDLAHFLTGQLLAVRDQDLWMMAGVACAVFAMVILFFRPLQLVSFDPVMAASIGVPVATISYAFTGCTSLVVVAGVNIVGVILVVGLLIIPAATAYLLCDRLDRMLGFAAFFGWTSFLLGYLGAEWLNVAPGSAVVAASALQFAVVFAIAPRYGLLADWRRRATSVPQHVIEDVLGVVFRNPGQTATMAEVQQLAPLQAGDVQRGVRRLRRDGLLVMEQDALSLTPEGRTEAQKLLRAHRLWETYLKTVGVEYDRLHDQAHELEHVHDADTLEYLDDKLGHPLRDPHGSEIPSNPNLVPGEVYSVSQLREGNVGVIVAASNATTPLLGVDATVEIGASAQQRRDMDAPPARRRGTLDRTRPRHGGPGAGALGARAELRR